MVLDPLFSLAPSTRRAGGKFGECDSDEEEVYQPRNYISPGKGHEVRSPLVNPLVRNMTGRTVFGGIGSLFGSPGGVLGNMTGGKGFSKSPSVTPSKKLRDNSGGGTFLQYMLSDNRQADDAVKRIVSGAAATKEKKVR